MDIRPSTGKNLTRPDKIELDNDLLDAAQKSAESGQAMEVSFDTHKEANAVLTKLRAHVNANGQGIRAKVAPDGDEWVLEFRVNPTKRPRVTKN